MKPLRLIVLCLSLVYTDTQDVYNYDYVLEGETEQLTLDYDNTGANVNLEWRFGKEYDLADIIATDDGTDILLTSFALDHNITIINDRDSKSTTLFFDPVLPGVEGVFWLDDGGDGSRAVNILTVWVSVTGSKVTTDLVSYEIRKSDGARIVAVRPENGVLQVIQGVRILDAVCSIFGINPSVPLQISIDGSSLPVAASTPVSSKYIPNGELDRGLLQEHATLRSDIVENPSFQFSYAEHHGRTLTCTARGSVADDILSWSAELDVKVMDLGPPTVGEVGVPVTDNTILVNLTSTLGSLHQVSCAVTKTRPDPDVDFVHVIPGSNLIDDDEVLLNIEVTLNADSNFYDTVGVQNRRVLREFLFHTGQCRVCYVKHNYTQVCGDWSTINYDIRTAGFINFRSQLTTIDDAGPNYVWSSDPFESKYIYVINGATGDFACDANVVYPDPTVEFSIITPEMSRYSVGAEMPVVGAPIKGISYNYYRDYRELTIFNADDSYNGDNITCTVSTGFFEDGVISRLIYVSYHPTEVTLIIHNNVLSSGQQYWVQYGVKTAINCMTTSKPETYFDFTLGGNCEYETHSSIEPTSVKLNNSENEVETTGPFHLTVDSCSNWMQFTCLAYLFIWKSDGASDHIFVRSADPHEIRLENETNVLATSCNKNPGNFKPINGNEYTFTCKARDGEPNNPRITWYLDDVEQKMADALSSQFTRTISVSDYYLILSCNITNPVVVNNGVELLSPVTACIRYDVQVRPTAIKLSSNSLDHNDGVVVDVTGTLGSSHDFKCSVEGVNPGTDLTFSATLDSVALEGGASGCEYETPNDASSFKICFHNFSVDVEPSVHELGFVCQVKHEDEAAVSISVTLSVKVIPTLALLEESPDDSDTYLELTDGQDYSSDLGASKRFRCTASDFFPGVATISWDINNSPPSAVSSGPTEDTSDELYDSASDIMLTMSPITLHNMVLTCTVSHGAFDGGEDSLSVTLKLKNPPTDVTFGDSTSSLNDGEEKLYTIGDNIVFSCMATSLPSSTLKISYKGTEVSPTHNSATNADTVQTDATATWTLVVDVASYKATVECKAEYDADTSVTKTITILLDQVPTTAAKISKDGGNDVSGANVDICTGESCTLTCETASSVKPEATTIMWSIDSGAQSEGDGPASKETGDPTDLFDFSSTLTMSYTRAVHDGKTVVCSITTGSTPPVTATTTLSINVFGNSLTFNNGISDQADGSTITVTDSETYTFTCISDGNDPAVTITWTFPSGITVDSQTDGSGVGETIVSSTLSDTTATAMVTPVFAAHTLSGSCTTVQMPACGTAKTTSFTFDVQVPHRTLTITNAEDSSTNQDNAIVYITIMESATLTCSSADVKPEGTLAWDSSSFSGASSGTQSSVVGSATDLVTPSLALTIPAPALTDHGSMVSCAGGNSVNTNPTMISIAVFINVLVPVSDGYISMSGSSYNEGDTEEIVEGLSYTFTCTVTRVKDAATFTWKIGSTVITNTGSPVCTEGSPDGTTGLILLDCSEDLTISPINSMHGLKSLVCEPSNNAIQKTPQPQFSIILDVLVKPVTPTITFLGNSYTTDNAEVKVVADTPRAFTCASTGINPQVTFSWVYREGSQSADGSVSCNGPSATGTYDCSELR